MKYHITVERTHRIGISFEADNNGEAAMKASELVGRFGDDEIFMGDCEIDYAVCDDNGRTIVDWDH